MVCLRVLSLEMMVSFVDALRISDKAVNDKTMNDKAARDRPDAALLSLVHSGP